MSLSPENQRLVNEIQLLQRCEEKTGLRAKPIIDQLITGADRPLPDKIPAPPEWIKFTWPGSGNINLESYWREVDRLRKLPVGEQSKWMGPYL